MANILKTLIPLLAFIAVAANAQTVSFTYDFYGEQPTGLTLQGDAHFPSATSYLRLTQTDPSSYPQPYSVGRAVYDAPIEFWDSEGQVDLETTVKFIVSPVDNNPADGLVFFIAPVGTTVGGAGASLGVFDSDTGRNPGVFAVEFDTYVNADLGDQSYRHIGIDIESLVSVNTTMFDDGSLGQEVTALIDYEEASKRIRVRVSTGFSSYEVSYEYDLSTVLSQQVQVGLSAATGNQVAVHDVVAWYFTATLVHSDNAKKGHQDSEIWGVILMFCGIWFEL